VTIEEFDEEADSHYLAWEMAEDRESEDETETGPPDLFDQPPL
jgi:hypothetical protein